MKSEDKKSTIKALLNSLVEVERIYAAGMQGDDIKLDEIYASSKFFNNATNGAYFDSLDAIAKRAYASTSGIAKLEGQLDKADSEIVRAMRQVVRTGDGTLAKKLMSPGKRGARNEQ